MPERPRDPAAVVTAFAEAWSTGDVDEIMAYFTADAVYHNVPVEPLEGTEAIRAGIEGFLAMGSFTFEIVNQVAAGDLVLNERIDRIATPDGGEIVLPVAGVFELRDGRIAAWRDYFDMTPFAGG